MKSDIIDNITSNMDNKELFNKIVKTSKSKISIVQKSTNLSNSIDSNSMNSDTEIELNTELTKKVDDNINSDNEIDSEIDSESEIDFESNKIKTQITSKGIKTIYSEYLEDNSLLLTPEYQRGLCWSQEKMNAFIDTIMKGWIVPNYVIYELSSKERKTTEHNYECVDGQHRLTTLKWYIEGTELLNTKKYIYWTHNGEHVFYNLSESKLKEMSVKKKIKCRNLTRDEKLSFDKFQMSFHIIESRHGLNINTKCDIFNRLQNGEKITPSEKLKNSSNIITSFIRTNKTMQTIKELNVQNKILLNSKDNKIEKYIYFVVRTFLIIDKQHLNINYINSNIKKYLEANNNMGIPSFRLNANINELYPNVLEIIEFITTNSIISKQIIEELTYILICIYANYDINDVQICVNWLFNSVNEKTFVKLNDPNTYKNNPITKICTSRITSAEKIIEQYDRLVKYVLKKQLTTDINV